MLLPYVARCVFRLLEGSRSGICTLHLAWSLHVFIRLCLFFISRRTSLSLSHLFSVFSWCLVYQRDVLQRLEQMWTSFFDYKPLPPSFQHCSSFTNNSASPPCREGPVTASPSQPSTSTVSRAPSTHSTSCSASLTSTASSPLPSGESHAPSSLSQCPEKHHQRGRAKEESSDMREVDSTASPGTTDMPQLLTQSSSWGELGFQHPLRDFRGAGCLAADCLLFLGGRFPSHARRLLQQSHEETFWMPFAVTSESPPHGLEGLEMHVMTRPYTDSSSRQFVLACSPTV